jgi:hypothetical protein
MKMEMDAGRLPSDFYIIGDEAFSCNDQLLVPYGGRGLGVWKDSFNYHLSSMRQCIERAFALYVQRWGIVWRALRTDFNRWPLVLTVCAKLHNFCIDRQVPVFRRRWAEDCRDGDTPDILLNEEPVENHRMGNTRDRRTDFTEELELLGIRRPRHAACNSRA